MTWNNESCFVSMAARYCPLYLLAMLVNFEELTGFKNLNVNKE